MMVVSSETGLDTSAENNGVFFIPDSYFKGHKKINLMTLVERSEFTLKLSNFLKTRFFETKF